MRPILALLLALGVAAAHADQEVRAGGFVVHYAAMATTELTAEVARDMGVTRAPRRGLLLVNVQREALPGTVAASAAGVARSLNGPVESLTFRVAQGDLVAAFEALDREIITFDLTVTPAGGAPIPVRFRQQFYQ